MEPLSLSPEHELIQNLRLTGAKFNDIFQKKITSENSINLKLTMPFFHSKIWLTGAKFTLVRKFKKSHRIHEKEVHESENFNM
jgi:hypothetical protein